MACIRCESVKDHGPTPDLVYMDPFDPGGPMRTFTCPHCQQRWWCYNTVYWEDSWTTIDDEETWRVMLSGGPIRIGYPAVALSVEFQRQDQAAKAAGGAVAS
jgi:hypothetical protein